MQPHGFEQHLVAVGGAIEGAGAQAMVGRRLRLQQIRAAYQSLRSLLPYPGLVVIRQSRSHGTCGNKYRGQMPEMQCTNQ